MRSHFKLPGARVLVPPGLWVVDVAAGWAKNLKGRARRAEQIGPGRLGRLGRAGVTVAEGVLIGLRRRGARALGPAPQSPLDVAICRAAGHAPA